LYWCIADTTDEDILQNPTTNKEAPDLCNTHFDHSQNIYEGTSSFLEHWLLELVSGSLNLRLQTLWAAHS